MKKSVFFIFYPLFLFSCYSATAQKESNKWFFGTNAGVDFNSGLPVALGGGALISQEGCASVSDNLGNLLFYTNGENVWNSTHVIMPGGTGLLGDNFTTQTAIIVPNPGNDKLYYIFTVSMVNGLRYSVVDMTAPGGNVTSTNNLLHASVTEKLIAVKDMTGCNVWVIIHEWNSNAFYAYLVTKSGINAPVVTNIGVSHSVVNGLTYNGVGCMKASPNGTKIAGVHQDTRGFELFDFNKSTGVLSNVVTAGTNYGRPYGVEFSPDNTKLYLTNQIPGPPQATRITQFDLVAANLPASAQTIGTSVTVIPGALQLASDNKIYLARMSSTFLGVINNPNTLGVACNFVDNGFSLIAMQCRIGLPQTVIVVKNPQANAVVNANVLCSGDSTGNATVMVSSGTLPYTYLWSTLPVQTTASATGLSAGIYTITVSDSVGCDSILTVTITEPTALAIIAATTQTACDSSTGTATANVTGGTAAYTYLWNNGQTTQVATGLGIGIYSITVTDSNSCTQTQTVMVTSNNPMTLGASSVPSGCSINDGTATANPANGTTPYTYNWSNGQTSQTATGLGTGSYTVITTDANGCTKDTIAIVAETSCPCSDLTIPNAFSPNNDGENDEFCLQGGIRRCIKELTITIYNRWGEKLYESTDPAFCWDGIYQGKQINTAVFFYYLEVAMTNNTEAIKQGNISLVR